MKKRVLSVLLAIAMVAVVLATGFAAMAAEETPAALKLDISAEGKAVTATVTAVSDSKIAVGEFILNFDDAKLELVSTALANDNDIFNDANSKCVFGRATAYPNDTVVFTAKFNVVAGPVDESSVSLTGVGAVAEDYTRLGDAVDVAFSCDHAAIADDAWEETTPATATEDGEKTATCPVCGKEVTEVIPALGVTPEEPTTEDTQPTEKPTTGDKTPTQDNKPAAKPNAGDKSPATGATVGVSAVTVMAAAAVVTLLARKKKED